MPPIHSDEAKRFADIVNGMLAFHKGWEIRDKYLAIRLSDGGYDGTLYDSKLDAVKHQSDEKLCAYFCFRNCLGGISYKEAEKFLFIHREVYAANGVKFADPDHAQGGPQPIVTNKANDFYEKLMAGQYFGGRN